MASRPRKLLANLMWPQASADGYLLVDSLDTHIGDLIFDAQQRRILFVTNIAKTYSELSESDADQYRKEWR